LCLEVFKQVSQVCMQVDEFHGGTLSHFAEFIKEERTVGILRGEFATSREPLDLTEVQGRYNEGIPKGSKLRRGRAIDPSHKDRRIYTWNRVSGFRGLKSRNIATGIAKSRNAISRQAKGTVWGHKGQ
jgi:hypothetical protein